MGLEWWRVGVGESGGGWGGLEWWLGVRVVEGGGRG